MQGVAEAARQPRRDLLGSDVIVATTNVTHLTRFVQARLWRDIS
jgi:hypothetical protein